MSSGFQLALRFVFSILNIARRMGARGLGARTTTIFIRRDLPFCVEFGCFSGIYRVEWLFQYRETMHAAPKPMLTAADMPTTTQGGRKSDVSTPIPKAGSATYPHSHILQHFTGRMIPFGCGVDIII